MPLRPASAEWASRGELLHDVYAPKNKEMSKAEACQLQLNFSWFEEAQKVRLPANLQEQPRPPANLQIRHPCARRRVPKGASGLNSWFGSDQSVAHSQLEGMKHGPTWEPLFPSALFAARFRKECLAETTMKRFTMEMTATRVTTLSRIQDQIPASGDAGPQC
eukprot:CAMPEP_0183790192 /NCGR_PEP_ID=MMETSP0803_2-20130417/853_1 /TAXON_ID=195967 /ORGANISM="Crustomastix stigmata, Strain CCMP3273" /LENGTH=162 /DNA_ID=CAMNT_0026034385 /DNA_START=1 /DNA_END=490 /DNA_ORIENTATION=+